MQIKVDKDNLRIIKLSQLESGEVDVTEVNFIFTPEYKDLIKTAVFTLEDKSYKVILQNDKCYIPIEVLVEGNKITIGVYAFKSEGEELILRYSPVPVTAEILKGSYVEEAENTSHPTPTEIEQLMNLIQSNTDSINDLSDRVDSLEEDKDKCCKDIDSIKDDLIDIKSDIQDLEDDVTSINSNINNINENIEDIESEILDINGDILNINTSITNIERVDERQNRRLNSIDNFIRQWPKTEYQQGTSINLGKTIQAPVQYEDDKVMYGDTEQEGTPTPTEPIPISVVTGTQEVVVRGKNLTNLGTYDGTINGISVTTEKDVISYNGTTSGNNNITPNGYNYVDLGEFKAGTYSLKLFGLSGTYNTNTKTSAIYLRNGEKQTIINLKMEVLLSEAREFTLETNQHLYFQQYSASGIEYNNFVMGIQIEQGSATTYEPYITPTTKTIHLGNIELAGIGDYKDYIYFDIDEGKWFKKGLVKKLILTGATSENWAMLTTALFFSTSISDYAISNNIPICNYYQGVTNVSGATAMGNQNDNTCAFINGHTNLRFYIKDSSHENATSLKTWLSTHNATLYYLLDNATDTEITDTTLIEELEELLVMQSVEGTTIIEVSGNLPATIKVKAFAQLQAAT